jgi:hypothetical protein
VFPQLDSLIAALQRELRVARVDQVLPAVRALLAHGASDSPALAAARPAAAAAAGDVSGASVDLELESH